MKTRLYGPQGSDSLLIWLNGWGMDSSVFSHWGDPPLRVMELHDYRNLSEGLSQLKETSGLYSHILVVAWSMGVWAWPRLSTHLRDFPIRAVAINGTPFPRHNHWGIPEAVFDATLQGMSPASLDLFYRNMFNEADLHHRFIQYNQPQRSLPDLVEELAAIRDHSVLTFSPREDFFHKVLISRKDRIVPARNQRNYWEGHPDIQFLGGGHHCFYEWDSWEDFFATCF